MPQSVHVTKANISQTQLIDTVAPALCQNGVRLKVQSFAVTANNITYAVIGDRFGYWNFFPTGIEGQGIVPMWGHAIVEASNHADIQVGERVYGYLPMATHLDVMPGKISDGGFIDTTDYRQPMSIFYNQYSRLSVDPEHDPAREAQRMIFGPLFKTGFLIEAMFRRENWYGTKALIMTSASSKTAMALASVAKTTSPGVKRIGLTSVRNVDFVTDTGLYDQVLAYDEVASLGDAPSVLVDFAGNAGLLRSIHETLGSELKYSCIVGATHISARGGNGNALPGPAPILFFAPDHASATVKELGPKGFGEAIAESWAGFISLVDGFVRIEERSGLSQAVSAFVTTVKGQSDPATGVIVRP